MKKKLLAGALVLTLLTGGTLELFEGHCEAGGGPGYHRLL